MQRKHSHGFTLIELMIAMVVFVVGISAVMVLIARGVEMQAFSRDLTMQNSLAKARLEQFRVLPRTHAQRSLGGSLTMDVADHFDVPAGGRFIRRWTVAAGPAGTQDITVVVMPARAAAPVVRIRARVE